MKLLEANRNGKYSILDADGNVVVFDHAIDAREALVSLDENGKHRYFLIEKMEKKSAKAGEKETEGKSLPEPKKKSKGSRKTKAKPSGEKTE